MKIIKVVLATSVCVLSACGGGGGGDSSTASTGPTATALISSVNAPAIAGAALEAIFFNDDLKDLDATGAGTSNATVQSRVSSSLMAQTAAVQIPVQCNVSGSIDRFENIADQQTLTVGDSVIETHFECDDGDGQVSDGRIEVVVDGFSGNLASDFFSLSVTMLVGDTNGVFRLTDAFGSLAYRGDMAITQSSINLPLLMLQISGDELAVDDNAVSYSLADYISTIEINLAIGTLGNEPYTMTASGFLMSSRFAGEIHYRTTRDLTGTGSGLPSAGEIVITGTAGATITVKPQSAIDVLLELDLDGDGAPENIISTTWAEITA
jgi:hypothetical protein